MSSPKGYKLCKKCGCPVLKKGQTRKNPDEYRHASGCPNDDYIPPVSLRGQCTCDIGLLPCQIHDWTLEGGEQWLG